MGVKTYLLCGVNLNEEIIKIRQPIKRDNLTVTPDILKFNSEKIGDDYIFINSINSCLCLCYYGEYDSSKIAYEDFYKNDENINYDKVYARFKNLILNNFKETIDESDWCTLICIDNKIEDNYKISNNEIIINSSGILDNNNLYIISILDCSFIYQAIIRVLNFTNGLVFTKDISKYEQFKLNYYCQEVYKINKPELFLTNTKEIELYKKIFEAWDLKSQIDQSLLILNQSVTNYSFLWNYNSNKSQAYVSSLLAIFTLLVGYSDLKSMVEDIFPTIKTYFQKIYIFILFILLFRLIIIYLVGIINHFKFMKKVKM